LRVLRSSRPKLQQNDLPGPWHGSCNTHFHQAVKPAKKNKQKTKNMKQQTLQSAPAQTATNRLDFFGTSTLASQPRILIANDSSEVCLLMSDTLSVAGFNTRAVTDGEAAWSELRRQSYDLLVTDLVMPRLGGLGLIQRVRDAGMNLPVIIASDSPSAVSVRDFVKLQIAAVIPKPFDIVEFQNLVKVALLASDGEANAGA
jgi:CheY-like chemotaxis protein